MVGFDWNLWGSLLETAGLDGDISLEKLHKWTASQDDGASGEKLQGIAFEKSSNISFGLSGQKDDFAVFMPWGKWPATNEKYDRDYPAPLQRAMLEVVRKGTTPSGNPLMDLASLASAEEFFTEKHSSSPSVAEGIAAWVNSPEYADKAPVVRILLGDAGGADREQSLKTSNFTNVFWPKSFLGLGRRDALVTNKKARIYVGYYNPTFHPKPDSPEVAFFHSTVKTISAIHPSFASAMKGLDADASIDKFVAEGLRAVSWNHGKLIAVNGAVVMTGGGNYWQDYKSDFVYKGTRLDHDIVDTQGIVVGDAAVSAHKWCDYFWNYLQAPPDPDKSSTWWGAYMNDTSGPDGGPVWIAGYDKGDKAPIAGGPPLKESGILPASLLKTPFKPSLTEANTNKGKLQALTVAKIGDWKQPSLALNHPVLLVDSIRDLLLNIYWQVYSDEPDNDTGLGARIWAINELVTTGPAINLIFRNYNINPSAWCSRTTRNWAIAYARSSVVICQQMLVGTLQNDEDAYRNLVAKVNTNEAVGIKNKESLAWDGSIWPFDLLIAIAQAIGAIYISKEAKTAENWKGVWIVLTTKDASGAERSGWADKTSIDRIKFRIRRVMKGLPTAAGGIPDGDIDKALNETLHFKRVLNDNKEMFQHSKIVCVDRKLMYVGSDNCYPCYNEEHGIWVDDGETVQKWLSGYFKELWARSTDARNEAPFKN